jgi:hypothetical protein
MASEGLTVRLAGAPAIRWIHGGPAVRWEIAGGPAVRWDT